MKKILRIILIIALLPSIIAYEMLIVLFIMPLIYGKRKIGIIGFIPCWLIYWCSLPLGIIPALGRKLGYLNNCANWCMGYSIKDTVSKSTGRRVDYEVASKVEIVHLKIFGMFDSRGWHGSPLCVGYFNDWR